MKKNNIVWAVVCIVLVAGSFFGGMKYGASQNGAAYNGARGDTAGFQGLGGVGGGRNRQGGGMMRSGTGGPGQVGVGAGGFGMRGNGVSGEILSKDAMSLTVKLPDGGSKIVFYTAATEVGKFSKITPAELAVGNTIFVNGAANPDGSITAQSVQIRP